MQVIDESRNNEIIPGNNSFAEKFNNNIVIIGNTYGEKCYVLLLRNTSVALV